MKKIILILAVIGFTISCTNNNSYTINGTINHDDNKIYLSQYIDGEEIISDSTISKDGKFTFSGYVDFPEVFYISFKDIKSKVSVFIEPSIINLNLTADTNDNIESEITGSLSQKTYDSFNKQMESFEEIDKNIYEKIYKTAKEEKDEEKLNFADSLFTKNNDSKKEFLISYAFNNNASVVSAYIVFRKSYLFNLKTLDSITTNFEKSIHNSRYYTYLSQRVDILKKVDIGQTFVDFTLNDTSGNPVNLSSLKGKYFLMDFWASWCGPCRRENPNVVSVYKDYKNKGFDIIGISFDNNEAKWKQAIIDDSLSWTQVSDLKGWKCEAGKLYGVRSIPHSVLVDPDGIIIAKNLRGEKLREKISEIFD